MSIEALIGISYAITAAGALFLVGVAPGHAHAQEMLAGSLLWVTWEHIFWGLGIAVFAGCCLYIFRKPLHEVSHDYRQALERGGHAIWWDFLFYVLLGAVITVAVRVTGVVVVFAFLIIPATAAVLVSSRKGLQLCLAGLVVVAGSASGLLFSYGLDFSVGPAVALCLAALLVLAAVFSRLRCIRLRS